MDFYSKHTFIVQLVMFVLCMGGAICLSLNDAQNPLTPSRKHLLALGLLNAAKYIGCSILIIAFIPFFTAFILKNISMSSVSIMRFEKFTTFILIYGTLVISAWGFYKLYACIRLLTAPNEKEAKAERKRTAQALEKNNLERLRKETEPKSE